MRRRARSPASARASAARSGSSRDDGSRSMRRERGQLEVFGGPGPVTVGHQPIGDGHVELAALPLGEARVGHVAQRRMAEAPSRRRRRRSAPSARRPRARRAVRRALRRRRPGRRSRRHQRAHVVDVERGPEHRRAPCEIARCGAGARRAAPRRRPARWRARHRASHRGGTGGRATRAVAQQHARDLDDEERVATRPLGDRIGLVLGDAAARRLAHELGRLGVARAARARASCRRPPRPHRGGARAAPAARGSARGRSPAIGPEAMRSMRSSIGGESSWASSNVSTTGGRARRAPRRAA